MDPNSQQAYQLRLAFGHEGARSAAERNDIVVVIDTFDFSTATTTAIAHGGIIIPSTEDYKEKESLSQKYGARIAVDKKDVPEKGRYSLSAQTFLSIESGEKVVLGSPNGATFTHYCFKTHTFWLVASPMQKRLHLRFRE